MASGLMALTGCFSIWAKFFDNRTTLFQFSSWEICQACQMQDGLKRAAFVHEAIASLYL